MEFVMIKIICQYMQYTAFIDSTYEHLKLNLIYIILFFSDILTSSLPDIYLRKESHAYSKGKILVVSKVPLPDYRADLDERHGSTQKEVEYYLFYFNV